MDWIHLSGISQIEWLQDKFKDYSSQMLVTSHLGNPKNAFLLYFPLSFFCKPSVGVQVLWVAALSEYMNAILKWMLHGERPYWWVQESLLYDHRPHLEQFKLTCETGPGSPSGHAMVTAAVWHTMLSAFIKCNLTKVNHRLPVLGLLWSVYAVLLTGVAMSRCYIGAHFPYQVALGAVIGILISVAWNTVLVEKFTLVHYAGCAVMVLGSGLGLYWILSVAGLDPLWSARFAKKWCARADWVDLNTSLIYALVRDSSALLGLGAGLYRVGQAHGERGTWKLPVNPASSVTYSLMGITLSLLLTQSSQYLSLPEDPPLLFYLLLAFKNALLPLVTVTVIPKVCQGLIANTQVNADDGARNKVS